MALEICDAEWGSLKRSEEKSVVTSYPTDLPPLNLNPLSKLSAEESQTCYGHFYPLRPSFDNAVGKWAYTIDVTPAQNLIAQPGSDFLSDYTRFSESVDGVFSIKNGQCHQQITNARIRVISIKRKWFNDHDYVELLNCLVYCQNSWGNTPREFQIDKSEYKSIFRKIHQEWPAVFLSGQDSDSLEAYLTKVFPAESILPVENVAEKIGWLTINGQSTYHMGVNPYYNGFELPTPCSDKRNTFLSGFAFLNIGNYNNEICMTWLVSHMPYSLFWLNKAGVHFHSILFLKGKTNLFKTAVVSPLANVFRLDRRKATTRLNSTRASLQEFISKSQDNLVCIDDFSNTVGADNREMVKNAEFVIRAIGDGQFPSKMKIKDRSKINDTNVRCAVIVTGEEEFGLSLSSDYRMIKLQILDGTFNPHLLSPYQDDPTILREYFALYIQFLRDCGEWVVEHCKTYQSHYRNHFRSLEVPRFIDVAVSLSLQVDIIKQFAVYCGIDDNRFLEALQNFYSVILNVLRTNQVASSTGKPEFRFLSALMQSIGTDRSNGLADDEKLYVEDETRFIGFWDKTNDQIWLRFPEAYALVKNYYSQLGQQFLVNEKSIKESLVRQGIAVGKINEHGANQYLVKAKKGSRKLMLVLNMTKVYEILKEGDTSW